MREARFYRLLPCPSTEFDISQPPCYIDCYPGTTLTKLQVLIDLHNDNSIYYCGNTLARGGSSSRALRRSEGNCVLKVPVYLFWSTCCFLVFRR